MSSTNGMPQVGRRIKLKQYNVAADLIETYEGRVGAVTGKTIHLGHGFASKLFVFPQEGMEWQYVLPPEPADKGALWFIPGEPGIVFQRRSASCDGPDFCWYRVGASHAHEWAEVVECGEGYLLDPQKGRSA